MAVALSEEELAARGIHLSEHDTVRKGLGPSAYLCVEFEGGLQCALERLDYKPELLDVAVPMTDDAEPLIERVKAALDISSDRVHWSASDEYWNDSRRLYNRDDWQDRRRRFREHS